MNQRILILSYYAQMPGACQAEWLDDKVDSLRQLGHRLALVSSACTQKDAQSSMRHYRVPSVSLTDFKDEVARIRARGESLPLSIFLSLPAVYTFGVVLDWIQKKLTGGVGEGRWSWALSAFFPSLWMALIFRPDKILSTGGPASSHLVAIAVGKLLRVPTVIEFQDPLSGADIGRNAQASGYLSRVERYIVSAASKSVYVTKAAAASAARKYQSPKIKAVYPGARRFGSIAPKTSAADGARLRLVHLGSLYATRNFDTLQSAAERLFAAGDLAPSEIEIVNLGHVADAIRERLDRSSYIKVLPPVGRIEALQFAATFDCLLLIQNADARSEVTIPYKTYDYLNLDIPILVLHNSTELAEMMELRGHLTAHISDVAAIEDQLKTLLSGRQTVRTSALPLDAKLQAADLISL